MNWDEAINLDRALTNCHVDMLRDWYYDPWGWPEMDWVVSNRPEMVYRRLNGAGTRPVAKLDVAKENFSIRPAVVMDPVDRIAYQALVDCLSRTLIGSLSTMVFGWRLLPDGAEPGEYARNDYQYANFRSRLTTLANTHTAALKTDIVSCFASIPVDRLSDRVLQLGAGSEVVDRMLDMIEGWDRVDGRSGLPQRSLASCVLANLYLQPLDDVLLTEFAPEPSQREQRWGTEGRAARWMDDIWLFGDDAGTLRRAQVELQQRMEDLGLMMNGGKTDVIEGRESLVEAVLDLQHSAVEEDLRGDQSYAPLNELIEHLLSRPERASRTSVRFATTRMRQHALFDRVGDFAEAAHRMPHTSDGLARLFRDSQAWRDMQQWFVWYEGSDWGRVDWAVSQFARMFPTQTEPDPGLVEHLGERVIAGSSLALTALAAQRLVSWSVSTARDVIRERRGRASHPLERRVLALAAVELGEEAWLVRELLGEYEENEVTLAMVEDRAFRPITAKPDFSGD